MKRIQEKVKDLVEVRPYRSLQDFISDPAQTLSAYYFTDATSEMMAKWLDKVAEVQFLSGGAKALAGYRGVGKSHFLATLGAIVSHPELRSRVTDQLVAAGAQRLKRRRYPVAYVRRGTRATLLAELREAIAAALEKDVSGLGETLGDLLEAASQAASDLPFVILVDTAFERAARVARDDGILLGELAEIATNLNIFIGVALDDDIAGADGVNASIARNYTIDYLDQDHLYRVIDAHVFPKHRQMQPLLHEIYNYFREILPSFRWSEQRFSALYPLHPLLLELAPFVRLYAPEFALLGFASEAGAKILGRPANSLIGLDEVFDRVENSLRKAEDLREVFATYDRLNADFISKVPIMQRLQAKLILKALLLLSLNGDGTTVSEISAAMLIFDENDPQKSAHAVEDLLETFVAGLPEHVNRQESADRSARYSLRVSSQDNLNSVLNAAAAKVSDDAVAKVLRRFASENFTDWTLQTENQAIDAADAQIVWRGGLRRGRVNWNWSSPPRIAEHTADFLDWEVFVSREAATDLPAASGVQTAFWQPAPLTAAESDAIKRYYVLLNETDLQESFGEQIRAARHTHSALVGKIFRRIFLEQGKLIIDGIEHSFSASAKNSHTLAEMLSETLAPLFEKHYPEHPIFAETLGMNEVSQLVGDLFSGARMGMREAQQLAANFAAPLNLVALRGETLILDSDENLLRLPFAQEILALLAANDSEFVPLKIIYQQLRREPFGLVREAVHLILAALVAQRRIEFVTSNGDRINRRSLDLKIIWDDITGVARPAAVLHSSAELTNWARTLTAVDTFKTIDHPEDREKIKNALTNWLEDWRAARVLERFDELPDNNLNRRIWQLSMNSQKTFGAVAVTVREFLSETISLEESLQRVSDAFSDSEKEFYTRTKDLVALEDYINGAELSQKIWQYLALCETTEDAGIEKLRAKLLEFIEDMAAGPGEILNKELERLWLLFQEKFAEHFGIKHDTVMRSHHLQEQFDQMMRSDEWWEFENLSALPIFQDKYRRQAQKICRTFRELDCKFDMREMLEIHPFCACSFRLGQLKNWENLPKTLLETVVAGRQSYRRTLTLLSQTLIPLFEYFAKNTKEKEYAEAAAHLAEIVGDADAMPLLSTFELIILEKVCQAMPSSPMLEIPLPAESGFLSREELREHLTAWLDELPSEPVLVKI